METQTTETPAAPEYSGEATYCPEDNKLRLYIGRVPRDEYLKLRAEGWTALHKQREAGGGDFVAHWTPQRRDTALEYAGYIGDEDQGPAERAADRAERFSGYRDKRTDEAGAHADRYDSQPSAHGFQSQARADRAASRHDRIAGRACDQWSKAEYWTSRTAGVISHALHVSTPGVRMGRIKILESEIRKTEKRRDEYAACFERWQTCAAMTDPEAQTARALQLAYIEHGDYTHPRTGKKTYLFAHIDRTDAERNPDPLTGAETCALWLSRHAPLAPEGDWLTHYRLRLSYENQMIEAQGGRAAFVEMVPGGWIRGGRRLGSEERQIVKVNKSNATGRVVSVLVRDNHPSSVNHYGNPYPAGVTKILSHTVEVERMDPDAYRAPTAEELIAFEASEKALKKARKASAPAAIPLINPTDADAERLQAVWNNQNAEMLRCYHHGKPAPTVARITQAQYSAASGGSFSRCETEEITGGGFQKKSRGHMDRPDCPIVAKVRKLSYQVVILTDKPQKPLTAEQWHDPRPDIIADLAAKFSELEAAVCVRYYDRTDAQTAIFNRARIVGLTYCDSTSQYGYTENGHKWATEQRERVAAAPAFALESETVNA